MPKHLVKQHNTWSYQRRVPKRLKELPEFRDKTIIKHSLRTDSLEEALRLRDKYNANIERIERGDISARAEHTYQEYIEAYGHPLGSKNNDETVEQISLLLGLIVDKYARGFDVDDAMYSDPLYMGLKRYYDEQRGIQPTINTSLREALNETLQSNPKQSTKKTINNYTKTVDKFLSVFDLDDVDLSDLNLVHAQQFIKHRREQSVTDKTIKNEIGHLSTIFKTAKRKGWIKESNPFIEPELSTKVSNPREPFSRSQVQDVLHKLKPQYQLIWKVLYYTGARIDEVLSFDDSSIVERESENGRVKCFYIPKGKTINAIRYIPIHPDLMPELNNFSGFKISRSRFNTNRKEIVTELYGEAFAKSHVTHSLRHTFSTTLHNHFPEQPQLVDWLTGHSKTIKSESFQTYFHGYGLDRLHEAVCKVPSLEA